MNTTTMARRGGFDIICNRIYGGWELAAIEGGRRISCRYYGHTKRDAVALFAETIKRELGQ